MPLSTSGFPACAETAARSVGPSMLGSEARSAGAVGDAFVVSKTSVGRRPSRNASVLGPHWPAPPWSMTMRCGLIAWASVRSGMASWLMLVARLAGADGRGRCAKASGGARGSPTALLAPKSLPKSPSPPRSPLRDLRDEEVVPPPTVSSTLWAA